MPVKRVLLVVLVASAAMLAMGTGAWSAGNAHALPPLQEPDPPGGCPEYRRGACPECLDAGAGQLPQAHSTAYSLGPLADSWSGVE